MRARSARATAKPAGGATAPTDDAELTSASTLSVEVDGAALHPGAALAVLDDIAAALASVPPDRAGVRLHGIPALSRVLTSGPITAVAQQYLGPAAHPIRAILFDKSATTNWTLGWHQDRTIAVRSRHDVPGYGPWSTKAGLQHVEPPFAIIAAMMTLRIHLDDVPADNAPLLIAPHSHRLGKVADEDAVACAERLGTVACLAARGDVWAYATPILHASHPTAGTHRRRVLQVDWSAQQLPPPLAWLGV